MVGTTDRIAVDLRAVAHDIGGGVPAQMGAHVRAVGVEHDHLAALAAIDHEVIGKKPDADRPAIQFACLRHHEPAAGKRELSQAYAAVVAIQASPTRQPQSQRAG